MANRRVIVKRRKAVKNIRKITRTMQLIATARFQATLNRATKTQAYTEKLAELVSSLTAAAKDLDHPLMKEPADVNESALVVITSDRGLCGGYNANILRTAVAHIDRQKEQAVESDVHMVGKKGAAYFRFMKRAVSDTTTGIGDMPKFVDVQPIADNLIDRFTKGEIESAYVTYMKFISTGTQRPVTVQLLPFEHEADTSDTAADEVIKGGASVEFEFSPEPGEILDELLPAAVRTRLFQAFNDAAVSEQIARMVAMKAATDAAGDMIKNLTSQYNRARQTSITMELLDIVGGANALAD